MRFLRLTQANTGVTIHVNMDQVVVIAPNKTGGAVLLTTAVDKDSARIVLQAELPPWLQRSPTRSGSPASR